MTFELGGMTFRTHTAVDPSSREGITYVYRTDLHPEPVVAHVHDYGVYIDPQHRYLDEQVLLERVKLPPGAAVSGVRRPT